MHIHKSCLSMWDCGFVTWMSTLSLAFNSEVNVKLYHQCRSWNSPNGQGWREERITQTVVHGMPSRFGWDSSLRTGGISAGCILFLVILWQILWLLIDRTRQEHPWAVAQLDNAWDRLISWQKDYVITYSGLRSNLPMQRDIHFRTLLFLPSLTTMPW